MLKTYVKKVNRFFKLNLLSKICTIHHNTSKFIAGNLILSPRFIRLMYVQFMSCVQGVKNFIWPVFHRDVLRILLSIKVGAFCENI